jgi:hypothetical protein
MNLLYGWDFSGILIPSLLALQWYQPYKLLASFVEAFVILGIAQWLMQTRLLRHVNIEGARKLLLFFNIGFVYKIILGYLLLHFMPQVKITDQYAFGYLLSTLMAVKMHDKDIAARFTRAILQTSFIGVVIASLVGFTLTLFPLPGLWVNSSRLGNEIEMAKPSEARMIEQLRHDKILLYQAQQTGQVPVALTWELETFGAALSRLQDYMADGEPQLLAQAAELLDEIQYQLLELEGRYLYLRERPPVRGWGLYVLNKQASGKLVIEVPLPLDESATFEAGVALFSVAGARALAIGGAKRDINPDGSANVLLNRQTLFQVFHRNLAQRDVLQVRRYNSKIARLTRGVRRKPQETEIQEPKVSLWVKKSLPPSLNLVLLKQLIEEVNIEWRGLPFANRQRETSYAGFAELVLNQEAVRKLRARATNPSVEPQQQVSEQRIDGFLAEWLLSEKGNIAARGSDSYRVPGLDELLYFDEEIVTPLSTAVASGYRGGEWTERGLQELVAVQEAALAFDYRIIRYRHKLTGQDYLILFEAVDADPRRYWGTYVFRVGPAGGFLVQVPRPLYEISSFEYGLALFERLQARALMIAGADPGANLDGSADLVRVENLRSLFSAVNQTLLREAGDAPLLVIHSRARAYRADLPQTPADVLLSVVGDVSGASLSSPLLRRLVDVLQADGMHYEMVDGRATTAGYEVANIPQSLYLPASRNKLFCALWLSPQARMSYRQQDEERQEALRFNALGMPTREQDLASFVGGKNPLITDLPLPESLRDAVQSYQHNEDVVTLARLLKEWPDHHWQRIIDRDSRQSFLVLLDPRERLQLIANLNPRQPERVIRFDPHVSEFVQVRHFVESRAALLEFQRME